MTTVTGIQLSEYLNLDPRSPYTFLFQQIYEVTKPKAFEDIEDGEMEHDNDGNLNYFLDNGYFYQVGHGRALCSRIKCESRNQYAEKDYPNNCGFHPQWRLPDNFTPCDDDCLGGLCPCLSLYAPGYEIHLERVRKKRK